MKIELSKREIEVILGLMVSGITFETTHYYGIINDREEKINLDNLIKKLKEAINEI